MAGRTRGLVAAEVLIVRLLLYKLQGEVGAGSKRGLALCRHAEALWLCMPRCYIYTAGKGL